MKGNTPGWRSLKTRITLVTLVIFVASIWVLAFYASRMLQEDTRRELGVQQFSTVSLVAADINRELEESPESAGSRRRKGGAGAAERPRGAAGPSSNNA
jgi:sensor histidine kinase regulating citrate/malate metabolism